MDLFLNDVLGELYAQPGPAIELRSPAGAVVGYLVKPDAMPVMQRAVQEQPRRLRRRAPLSKRQRDAAKRERLGRGEEAARRS